VCKGSGGRSTDRLLTNGDLGHVLAIDRVAKTRLLTDMDGASRGGFDRRRDDVALPIAVAGRDIAGQNEIRKSGKRNVVRAPDAGFEHAAAPHRDSSGLRDIVNALGLAEPAHAPEFDIDDAACAQPDGL